MNSRSTGIDPGMAPPLNDHPPLLAAPRDGRVTDPARRAPAAAGLIAFAVYLRTLLPGTAFGDWGEMQTVPHVLGIAHPTGYPTYLITAWLGQLIPVGSVAFRANAVSAVSVSLTIAVIVAIGLVLGVRPFIAVGGALCLAAVTTVWAAATAAEVNGLHVLFVALLLHRALIWEDQRRPRDLFLGGLLTGLALGNHLLTLFVAPFIGLFVLWTGRHEVLRRPVVLMAGIATLLIGLSVYLYIPIAASRAPALAYNHPVTLETVWWLVSGAQFRGQFDFLSPAGPVDLVRNLPALWSLLVARATIVLPTLGLIGLVVLLRRRPAFGLTVGAILIGSAYLWASYLRLEHYLLVAWLVLAIGFMTALDSSADRLDGLARSIRAKRGGRQVPSAGGLVVGLAAAVFATGLAASNWGESDRSDDVGAEVFVATAWRVLPPDAAILTPWDVSTPLWHSQIVLGARRDVLIVDDTNIVYDGWGSRENRIASLICDRPVFIVRLDEAEVARTSAFFRVTDVVMVGIGRGGPTAVITRPLSRVAARDDRACER
ncbi:MAG: DUF2723 domain-containing protein [Chloroflexi bacterium]|nr:DUF2723 domain-containing protein [Chloroflexota bacterium]